MDEQNILSLIYFKKHKGDGCKSWSGMPPLWKGQQLSGIDSRPPSLSQSEERQVGTDFSNRFQTFVLPPCSLILSYLVIPELTWKMKFFPNHCIFRFPLKENKKKSFWQKTYDHTIGYFTIGYFKTCFLRGPKKIWKLETLGVGGTSNFEKCRS